MDDAVDLLREAKTILLVDWPSREVPDTLARSGLGVVSADGPDAYNAYEADGDAVRVSRVAAPPPQVDMVYVHRPIDELPGIVERAVELGARTVWLERSSHAAQEGERARQIVESAGLAYVSEPYIADAARGRRS